jgi:hypothetical protein
VAYVIGPNGIPSEVPDEIAPCLVGDGNRGYSFHTPEPEPEPKRAPVRRASKTAE